MERLPYVTFPTLSPEEKREHIQMLRRRFRENHRKELNAQNKKYVELWKITKPFVVTCHYCGNTFNASRKSTTMCPACHAKAQERAQATRNQIQARKDAKEYLITMVKAFHEEGMLQREIAWELNISQRRVSYLLIKMGIRTQNYGKRKNNSV